MDQAELETRLLRCLGGGDLAGVRALVSGVPAAQRSLTLRLVAADADVQSQVGDVLDLEVLRDDVEAAAKDGGSDFSLWMQALLAEYFFWRGDPLAYVIAHTALSTAPSAMLPSPLLAGRGRLRRVKGIGMLLAGDPEAMAEADAEVAAAVTDLGRAGWEEQQALTAGIATYMRVAGYWDGIDPAWLVLQETCDRLSALGSQYAALAYYGLAHVAFIRGDLATVHEALGRCDSLPSPFPVQLDLLVRYVRALARVVGEGGSPGALAELAALADDFRRDFPQVLGSVCVTTAGILADLGREEAAREWGGRARYSALVTAFADVDRPALFARLDHVTDPSPENFERVRVAIEAMVDAGEPRYAGFQYLRTASDCERLGFSERAAQLRDRAAALLPPPEKRTLWELLLARPTERAAGALPGEIVTFAPRPFVRLDGVPADLPEGAAKLLALLVAERGPVPAERCTEALWPETAPATGRNRLSQVLFRLRKVLGVGIDELVVRRGDTLVLEPGERWRVDAWELRRAAERGPAALAPVGAVLPDGDFCADLCDVDPVIDAERHRLRALRGH